MADRATVRQAHSVADVEAVRALFVEYQAKLVETEGEAAASHICFQDFATEVSHLDAVYGPPRGALVLAEDDSGPVGCAGLRPTREVPVCEIKRLYMRAGGRGQGLGRDIARTALNLAASLGYQRVVLDTLPSMHVAMALYRSLGFRERAAYYEGAPVDTVYFERSL